MSSTERYQLIEQLPDLIPCEATQTWLGTDLTLDRAVTIRLTEVDSEVGLRLRLQTQSLAAFEHPALLHILDSYVSGRQFAIVTERLPPHTLADELLEDGEFTRLSELEALQAAATAAEGLQALHAAGFTHGGVSAAQIGRRREGGFILLTGPPTGDAITIPATRKDDIRSLAALAHELLVGAPPEQRNDNSWRINSAVSPAMKSVLKRACSEDDPWPDAGALMVVFKDAAKELSDKDLAARDLAARDLAARDLAARGQAAGKLDAGRTEAARTEAARTDATSSAAARRVKKIVTNGWTAVAAVIIIGTTVLGGGAWLLAQSNSTDAGSPDTGQADTGQTDTGQTDTGQAGSGDGGGAGGGGAGSGGSSGDGADGSSGGTGDAASGDGASGDGASGDGAGGNANSGNNRGTGADSANGNGNAGNGRGDNSNGGGGDRANGDRANGDRANGDRANGGSDRATDPNPSDELTRVPTEIALITDFDPLGDDVIEHPELLLLLNDGDPLTGWRTSLYTSSDFGGLKEGVGLLVELGGDSVPDIARVVIESPSIGWTFQLLASEERRATQIEWGEPVAEVTVERAEPITLSFPAPDETQLGAQQNAQTITQQSPLQAATLLLWITDLGEELEVGGYRVTINGIRISRYHQP